MASRPAAPIVPMPWELDPIQTSRRTSLTSADALSEREEATATEQPLDSAPPVALRNERIDSGAVEGIDRSGAFRSAHRAAAEASQDPTRADGPGGKGGATPGDCYSGEVCDELLPEEALGLSSTDMQLAATPLLDLALTFRLQSNPGASKVIYLDFNGHTTTGTSWNNSTMGASFYSPAYDIDGDPNTFSDTELGYIQRAWQRVSEDFSPFDVNVTLQEPLADWLARIGSSDGNWGVRSVITSYGPSSSTAAGIAFVGSFNSSADTPVFIYNESVQGVCEAVSHEVGHSLGLSHDGTASTSYYTGHGGTGETSWAPIMGGSYNRNVTTWDDGGYTGSNNTGSTANYGKGADDLAVIVSNNGFSYQPDLAGNDLFTASPLAITGGAVGQFGTIETRLDTDCYTFSLVANGDLNLSFDPYWYVAFVDGDGIWGGSNLAYLAKTSDIRSTTPYADNASNIDLAVQLFDSQGRVLYTSNDAGLATAISLQGLTAGTYYLKLDGVGFGDPTASTPTGYTDYASIGNYMISGTITSATDSTANPVITLALTPGAVSEDGSSNLVFTFTRSLVTADPLSVNFTVSGTASNGSDYTGLLAGNSQIVTFAANAATASVVINPTADTTVEADETVVLSLAIGTGYTIGTPSSTTGIISNDDFTPKPLVFTTQTDILTGTTGADNYVLSRHSDALWSSTPDRITNLQAGVDTIDSPFRRTNAIYAKQLGLVQSLDAAGIEGLLTSRNLVKNGAATFTFGAGSELRTFLAINDDTAGFKSSSDSVIEITDYAGSLSSLAIF
ncbi:MAG: bluetail domain-containing putative surface protein [Cyanobacteriota bacterium]|jgi:hypothetical protein